LILLALAFQAAAPQTAVEAERAFANAAQTEGQWTAFRKFAAEDATIFTPQPEKAQQALPTKNPPIAVQWWPAQSYVSCDGSVAVNTGPWVRPKANGYFTTVWNRQKNGDYKWIYDGGDQLARPRPLPEKPRVRVAACGTKPIVVEPEPCPRQTHKCDSDFSPDNTLAWDWSVDDKGAREFTARLWNGRAYETVVHDVVEAPPQ
jgi:hypothetical protein